MKGEMQIRRDAGYKKVERHVEAGHEGAGQEGFRTGEMQNRRDAGQEG